MSIFSCSILHVIKVSNLELTQIFFDGLGLQNRYLLDAASGDTFMRKSKVDTIELIKVMTLNDHHNAAKPLKWGATSKGQLIDAKSLEMGMLVEMIEKVAKVKNLLLDRLNIWNDFERLTLITLQGTSLCTHCSRLDHIELNYHIMVVQWQGMFR